MFKTPLAQSYKLDGFSPHDPTRTFEATTRNLTKLERVPVWFASPYGVSRSLHLESYIVLEC